MQPSGLPLGSEPSQLVLGLRLFCIFSKQVRLVFLYCNISMTQQGNLLKSRSLWSGSSRTWDLLLQTSSSVAHSAGIQTSFSAANTISVFTLDIPQMIPNRLIKHFTVKDFQVSRSRDEFLPRVSKCVLKTIFGWYPKIHWAGQSAECLSYARSLWRYVQREMIAALDVSVNRFGR